MIEQSNTCCDICGGIESSTADRLEVIHAPVEDRCKCGTAAKKRVRELEEAITEHMKAPGWYRKEGDADDDLYQVLKEAENDD